MPSDKAILGCWALLQASGLPRPWLTEDEAEQALSAWRLVLGDTSDDRLIVLTTAWLRSSEVRYGRWPMPGALLHALGSVEQVDDADEAWAEALGLLANFGRDRCPLTVEALEDWRGRMRAAAAQARELCEDDRADRLQRALGKLPRMDSARNEALLAGVRACGGWKALGSAEEHDLVAHRASFRATYRAHRQRAQLTEGERQVEALLGGAARWPAGQLLGES